MEAVRTNILGAENVLNAAIANSVQKVIVLSTDKAVYPINAMGISKAMMEKLMVAKSRTDVKKTVLCGTRYGNVMASRGSVIPLFVKQIKEGKPLTVTDPNMTRFMMSLEDSVDLVVYAFNMQSRAIFLCRRPRLQRSWTWRWRSRNSLRRTMRSRSSGPGMAKNCTKRC